MRIITGVPLPLYTHLSQQRISIQTLFCCLNAFSYLSLMFFTMSILASYHRFFFQADINMQIIFFVSILLSAFILLLLNLSQEGCLWVLFSWFFFFGSIVFSPRTAL